MFDPKSYRERCAQLTLGEDKKKEIIAMTEKKSDQALRRPGRTLLIAAAVTAALGITASAASAGGFSKLLDLFHSSVIIQMEDDVGCVTPLRVPDVALGKTEEGRVILTVDGEETDVTDALREGGYTWREEREGYITEVEVTGEDAVTIRGHDPNGDLLLDLTRPAADEIVIEVGDQAAQSYVVSIPGGGEDQITAITLKPPEGDGVDTAD